MTPIRPDQPPRFPATPFPGAVQPPFLPNVHDPLRYVRRGVFDGVVKSLSRDLATLSQGLSDAMEVAESAESQAAAAKQSADDASSAASSASTAASEAKATADKAQSTASAAQSTASEAQSTATTARDWAASASATADKAQTTASDAADNANNAYGAAANALGVAQSVQSVAYSNEQDISDIKDQLASFPETYATKDSIASEYLSVVVDEPGQSTLLGLPTGPTHHAVYDWRNTSAGEYEFYELTLPDLPADNPSFRYELDVVGHSAASTTALSVFCSGTSVAFVADVYHDFYLDSHSFFHLRAVSSYASGAPVWLVDVRTFS